jgi:hypothetical protein
MYRSLTSIVALRRNLNYAKWVEKIIYAMAAQSCKARARTLADEPSAASTLISSISLMTVSAAPDMWATLAQAT